MTLVRVNAQAAERIDRVELPATKLTVPIADLEQELRASTIAPAPIPSDAIASLLEQIDAPSLEEPTPAPPSVAVEVGRLPPPQAATVDIAPTEKATLIQRLARIAEESGSSAQSELTWEHDGRQYAAVLTRQTADDGMSLERVIAEVTTSDEGRRLKTRLALNRLAFSQFTQIVDRWDPKVQLHDDEIVGRFHSNTQMKLLADSRVAPKFLGKVTTAARGFNTESKGRRRGADIFLGGVQTRTTRIHLPEEVEPLEWAHKSNNARVHEFAKDARITFFEGGYTWRTREFTGTDYIDARSADPVYFVGDRGVTLHVKGVVSGKILVYTPDRIVIEGDLRYARDPRRMPDSPDYLGLVSDRNVVVASPSVTGRGDLEIDAAIFAGRRFLVTHIDYPRTATLKIFGSVTAGTLSATEPRYATKLEYDSRFERRRPPGFPSTNRYEVDEDWDAQWTEIPETVADE